MYNIRLKGMDSVDFIDILKQFSAQVEKKKDMLQTEEATKMALIMPFFAQVLGYDVFNPDEFIPEFTADVGIKKHEKVDYAINIDGVPTILVEAKWCGEALEKHDSQLFRYFGTSSAKFAILTNGIIYKFYTDLQETNKMDLEPFFEINLLNIKDSQVPELKRFCKASFNAEEMFDVASRLRYSSGFKKRFASQLKDPSDEFVRFMLTDVYHGVKTQAIIDKFKPLVKSTLNGYINEMLSDKITNALSNSEATKAEGEESAAVPVETAEEAEAPIEEKGGIRTTDVEMAAFYIVCALLSDTVEVDRIAYKDTTNYFGILLDGMPSKWFCRLKLERAKKYIIFRGDGRNEEKIEIATQNDIYKYKDQLKAALERVMK